MSAEYFDIDLFGYHNLSSLFGQDLKNNDNTFSRLESATFIGVSRVQSHNSHSDKKNTHTRTSTESPKTTNYLK